ncbi:hypothetical protein [Anaerolinea thermophila]|uniref:DUF5667 domain-containing protein n=1 Tax=Anaerolinea thermophila (strain DSM 14523 / JCM 11388 / NBRC 100420 / UNI-1) TaxID=926569 RepID=E8N3U0_ANATU|nr:hypothetical protein [Anaerolinea thermophila]BAJ63104.1 hypothetical protein ANT_10700 [Anaerolinea thermophila UNI-1]
MKHKMMKWLSVLVVLVMALGSIAAAPSPVDASGIPAQEVPPSDEAGMVQRPPRPEVLEQAYQRLQKTLEAQKERLQRAEQQIPNWESKIAELKQKGLDTSALEKALANFKDSLMKARQSHEEAARILAQHPGFDENGKVVDPKQAAQTVRDAGKAIRVTHRIMENAMWEMLRAFREFRRDNRPNPGEPRPPKPPVEDTTAPVQP